MDYSAKFDEGLSYHNFLAKYATAEQKRRWDDFHAQVSLTDDQKALLRSFKREMKVLALVGAWCGDCVNQCPIWEHFAAENAGIRIHYFDRDDNPDLAGEITICGGQRVPSVVFLSEDGHLCGRHGDRTLSKYRSIVQSQFGASCPTGLFAPEQSLTQQVVQDWLDEFERIQWMLRTSGRLRELHGD